uniref:Uncharacterized protein n=1 Tax=Tanacetum cinerariifolium TaxID=118510 RepID=A0A699GTF2_TANCI|nr:hypothetical protein [Tanacetum cinerariifolium]
MYLLYPATQLETTYSFNMSLLHEAIVTRVLSYHHRDRDKPLPSSLFLSYSLPLSFSREQPETKRYLVALCLFYQSIMKPDGCYQRNFSGHLNDDGGNDEDDGSDDKDNYE